MSKARRAKKRKKQTRSLKRGLLYVAAVAATAGFAGGVVQQLAKGRS